jgi:hypothetical protein
MFSKKETVAERKKILGLNYYFFSKKKKKKKTHFCLEQFAALIFQTKKEAHQIASRNWK